ncbi:transcriptional regulator [Citrobacter rodentium]|jgi:Response regulator containing a CheY-like receiver domain and an HTH DNA-binding domain|uniref:Transcriptional regulator n=2 Tax=Citrobacter rodentium TaxID=67825 RepID=D2TQT0_CITRI|nr:transcriptional regulator [Citrobacter rodentium]KIQ49789.1 transcriptional regulator [Citrobacter rodentium]QBY29870.1 DNA-binding response regulator [Citrobacter rodentium]UHO32741.1 DNA-binding response regulator [Citrobacter rodentium NBRC 105723 = DSM 16636]CBG90216.1 putative transcriptional regulator [Citrobacter rodentium ICC168]HAT8014189.1 DNA-binding response regulator [Citrobacter rodentium NBRC 105723 = DSM 16636]
MDYQCFLYDKNFFYSQGIKTVISRVLAGQAELLFSLTDDYARLITALQMTGGEESRQLILCDLDSLPRERFSALQLMKSFYRQQNKHLVVLVNEHNLPLFFTLYSLLPEAHWLLKNEHIDCIAAFFQNLVSKGGDKRRCFSDSLVNYTRERLHSREGHYAISGNEWWLMEEIFKGKSLSQISSEVNMDVRRLSYIKRHLMKRLNIRNNIALFAAFKGIMP